MKKFDFFTDEDINILHSYGLDQSLLTGCVSCTYDFGEHIVSEGIFNASLFIVTNGRAKVGVSAPNGKNIILCFYISSGLIGEAEYFSGEDCGCTTVTALESLRCIVIPIRENRSYLDNNLLFSRIAAKTLAEKLLERANSVIENTLYSAEVRLCRYIIEATKGDLFQDIMMDVAYSVGVSYRHLYRMMGTLCKDGVLEKCHSGYRICDRKELKKRGQQK